MNLLIRGDKVKVTDAMNQYLEEKLQKLDKYFEDSNNVHVTVVVKIKEHRQKVEVTIPLKSFILRAEEEREDFYASVDTIIDKLERQIRKNKTRLESKVKNTKEFIFVATEPEEETNEVVVKRKKIEVKPMDEEEAILQLELLGHQFYLYKDIETDKPTVIYKRKDGGYGIIEAE